MVYFFVSKEIELSLLNPFQARELFQLTEQNRGHLRKWLPWLDGIKEYQDTENFIIETLRLFALKTQCVYAILYNHSIIGVIGFNHIDWTVKTAAVGYWLSEEFEGNGFISNSLSVLERWAFCELGLNKLEIRCAVENCKSRAIPERKGYVHEGTVRYAENLYGTVVDHEVYGLSIDEFNMRTGTQHG